MVIISGLASFSQGNIRFSIKMRGRDSPFPHVPGNLQHNAQRPNPYTWLGSATAASRPSPELHFYLDKTSLTRIGTTKIK
jgi:hypothetical protein